MCHIDPQYDTVKMPVSPILTQLYDTMTLKIGGIREKGLERVIDTALSTHPPSPAKGNNPGLPRPY